MRAATQVEGITVEGSAQLVPAAFLLYHPSAVEQHLGHHVVVISAVFNDRAFSFRISKKSVRRGGAAPLWLRYGIHFESQRSCSFAKRALLWFGIVSALLREDVPVVPLFRATGFQQVADDVIA